MRAAPAMYEKPPIVTNGESDRAVRTTLSANDDVAREHYVVRDDAAVADLTSWPTWVLTSSRL